MARDSSVGSIGKETGWKGAVSSPRVSVIIVTIGEVIIPIGEHGLLKGILTETPTFLADERMVAEV